MASRIALWIVITIKRLVHHRSSRHAVGAASGVVAAVLSPLRFGYIVICRRSNGIVSG